MIKSINDEIDVLLSEMKSALYREDVETIEGCLRVANDGEKWKVDMFHYEFMPKMTRILDGVLTGAISNNHEGLNALSLDMDKSHILICDESVNLDDAMQSISDLCINARIVRTQK